jgi:hypothetical protein
VPYETDRVGGIGHNNESDRPIPKRRKKKEGEEGDGRNDTKVVGRRRNKG